MHAFALFPRDQFAHAALDDPGALAELARSHSPRILDQTDIAAANAAWGYFSVFTDSRTGFAPASDQCRNLTLWEMGSNLLAIVCASHLGLLEPATTHEKISQCLTSLIRLQLDASGLPARRYCPTTLRLFDDASRLNSADALMRLVAGFIVIAHHYPALAPEISLILHRWNFDALHGQNSRGGRYAVRAARLINLPIRLANNRHDTSAPFAGLALEAMEFGWRPRLLNIVIKQHLEQKQRFNTTAALPQKTSEAFACSALLPNPFSQKQRDAISDLATPNGWQSEFCTSTGRPKPALLLNTNAAVLEALHYRAHGPLFGAG